MRYNQPFGVSDPNAPYVNGNPATGVQGSIPPASSIEHDQREVVEVITRANARGYKDFSDTLCAPATELDLTQLRKAIEGFVRALPLQFGDLIDTYVTFTVHGTGADFANLIDAFHYLSKFKITSTGRVVLQLAGAGASGLANQYVYTTTVIIDHPNNHRIFVLGAQLRAPVNAIDHTAFTLTGNTAGARASDTAANLTMLRTKYATELRFNNCNGFEIVGTCVGILSGVLITSNGAAGPQGVMVSAASSELNVGYLYTGISTGQGVAVVGFDTCFYFGQCGNASAYVLDFPQIAIGSTGYGGGFWSNANASFQPGGKCLSFSNAGQGFMCTYSWLFFDTNNNECAFNGGHGVFVAQGMAQIGGCKIWGNAGWGVIADQGSACDAGSCVFGLAGVYNAAGDAYANHMSYINVANSSGYRSIWSPGLGAVGNVNSIVTYA